MNIKPLKPTSPDFPPSLNNIPYPPKHLYALGDSLESLWAAPMLSVIGSRRATPYGLAVTRELAGDAAQKGIVIVSGMALGIDGAAHKAALEAGGKTVAVLPCGLDRFYPATHNSLGRRIVEKGGAIITEYPEGTDPRRENFIERNRLVSGISQALLVVEAAERSGTLHTVNFALEQGKTVLAVPGNITSPISKGTNNLIKAGATPVTDVSDILAAMNISEKPQQTELLTADTEEELVVLRLLQDGLTDGADLLRKSELETAQFNQALTMLELAGRIKPLGAGHWTLK